LCTVREAIDANLMRQIPDEAHRPFDLEHRPCFGRSSSGSPTRIMSSC
jgi:hypothetical protein